MSTDITRSNKDEIVTASPNPIPPHKKLSRRKVLALAGSGTLVLGSIPHFGTALAELVGDPIWQTLMAFRIGYSTHEGLRSPRLEVNEVAKP